MNIALEYLHKFAIYSPAIQKMNIKARLSLPLLLASMVLAQAGNKSAPVAATKEKSEANTGTDSYRWTEDPKSPEAGAWIVRLAVDAQAKNRPQVAQRLTEMLRAESLNVPCAQDGIYFFTKREGNEKQPSIYWRKGLQGNDERLIDATKLSAVKNASLTIADSSDDAGLLIYGVHAGAAEEQIVHIFDTKARRDLSDTLPRARYSSVNFSPDKKGIYFAKVEPAGTHVFFHPLGTEIASDKLIFGDSFNYEPLGPKDLISLEVTENGRYLLLSVARGVPVKRVDVYSQELDDPDQGVRAIIHSGRDDHFSVVNHGEDVFVLTDNEARRNRVVKIIIDDPHPTRWTTIVPEGKDLISDISIVGERIFLSGVRDGVTQTRIFTLDGKEMGEITYPAIGFERNVHHRCSAH
jgi:prolyl oligopeptidase